MKFELIDPCIGGIELPDKFDVVAVVRMDELEDMATPRRFQVASGQGAANRIKITAISLSIEFGNAHRRGVHQCALMMFLGRQFLVGAL